MRKKSPKATGRDREGFTVEVVPAPEADTSALDAARAILVREVLRRLEAREARLEPDDSRSIDLHFTP